MRGASFDALAQLLPQFGRDDLPLLYGYASAWAGWIQVRSGDWKAIAELPKVKLAIERVAALDPGYDKGGAQLYLGVLESLLPAVAGGQPEKARKHFEQALMLSNNHNLMAKVLYAERYARAQFDRELHDRLLREVLAANPRVSGFTLSNVMAQERARQLLASGEQYF